MILAAAEYGRAIGRHDAHPPPPPQELIEAWRTRDYGLPSGGGWKDEPAGSLERMTQALNVYTAFKAFEERTIPESEFADKHFDLWKIVISVEKQERKMNGVDF